MNGLLIRNSERMLTVSKFTLAEENKLHQKYKLIGCDCVDYVPVEIGGYNVDLWFDDKAQLKMKSPTFPLTLPNGEIFRIIFGNIIVLACDDEGKSVGLTDDFIEYVQKTDYFEKKYVEANKYMFSLVFKKWRK